MWFRSFLDRATAPSNRSAERAANPRNSARRLLLENLEGRSLLAVDFLSLDVPGATSTESWGINDSAQIVGNYTAGGITHGYLRSEGSYTTLDVPGATSTAPSAINDSGQIAGSYVAGGVTHAFVFSDGIYTTIDPPGSTFTMPRGMNDAGQIVGGYQDAAGKLHGFLYSVGTFTTLDVPGASFTSYASGINDLGQIVGRFDTATSNFGFLLSEGVYTTIDVPDSISSAALDIKNSGLIVGGYTAGGTRHGYLLSEGTYTKFDVPGSTLTTPFKINDSGLIVGFYVAEGTRHGFIATAEPPTKVESLVVNDGSSQRSMVNSLTVTFDHLVIIDPDAFELRSQEGSLVGLNMTSSVNGSETIVVLTFTGSDIISGSLADGNYTLTIRSNLVHDGIGRELDGDSDGSAGGDRVDAFFRLFGDSDGDCDVDHADLDLMLSSFGKSQDEAGFLWFFDYDGGGSVDGLDMAQFNQRRRN
jgi:probable HAF family extracellular repeat protein